MNFDKSFHKKEQYRNALLLLFAFVLIGVGMQWFLGSIPKHWFRFPQNVYGGLGYVGFSSLFFFVFKRTAVMNFLASIPLAIVSIVTLGVFTIGLGSIAIKRTEHSMYLFDMGLEDITKSWYYALVFMLLLSNLWFAILKKSLVYSAKNINFLLNHFGLWLVMFAGVLGQGDVVRLRMDLKKDEPEWRATDEQGKIIDMPVAIELKEFKIDIFQNKLFVIDSTGGAIPKRKPAHFMLDYKHPKGQLLDWKITLKEYIQNAVPQTDTTYVAHPMWGSTNAALVEVEYPLGKKQTTWLCAGNFQFSPKAMQLDEYHTLVMASPEAKRFESEVVVYEKETGKITQGKIEVNHPMKVGDWKIYQVSYNEKLGRWSETSQVEFVLDPWLPLVYTGIFIMMAGCVGFLFQSREI